MSILYTCTYIYWLYTRPLLLQFEVRLDLYFPPSRSQASRSEIGIIATKGKKLCRKHSVLCALPEHCVPNQSILVELCMCVFCCSWLFVILWIIAFQFPLSLGFFRQEYRGGLPFPPPGDLPDPGIEPASPVSPALQADSYCWVTREAHVN